jgi:hypothetical protein
MNQLERRSTPRPPDAVVFERPEAKTPLVDNLAALADSLEKYTQLLETAHAEIKAEQAKTDEILKNIKKSWSSKNEN